MNVPRGMSSPTTHIPGMAARSHELSGLHFAAFVLGFVVSATFLGLGLAMSLSGPEIVASVWGASIGGSLLFAVGAALVGAGGFVLARRYSAFASVPLAFVALWLVYAWSWSITGAAMGHESSQTSLFGGAWSFVFQWGWLGLVIGSVLPAGVATWMRLREMGGVESRPARRRTPAKH